MGSPRGSVGHAECDAAPQGAGFRSLLQIRARRSRSALPMTDTELQAHRRAGDHRATAAGRRTDRARPPRSARRARCRRRRRTGSGGCCASSRGDSARARTMPRRSPFTSVTPALSIATSVPVPIAMPTSACASAGRVVDAVARHRDDAALRLQPLDDRLPSARGSTSATTSSMPELARRPPRRSSRLSPVSMTTRMPSARSAASASGVGRLDRVGDAEEPAPAVPSTATNMTVCAVARAARRRAPPAPPSRRRARPSARGCRPRRARPSTRPSTPLPVSDCEVGRRVESQRRARSAPATIAAASGCSLPRSRLAARRSSSVSSSTPGAATTATSLGLPSVSVPVLSTTSVSTLLQRSRAPRRS